MSAIVPAAIVFFIMATSLMALVGCRDDEAFRPIRKLSFGHDITVMRAKNEPS
jgi:hypothetical protein